MSTWTLPAVETYSYSNVSLFIGFSLAECNDLMSFFRNERIISFNRHFELFCFEFELLTENQAWTIIKDRRIVNRIFYNSSS